MATVSCQLLDGGTGQPTNATLHTDLLPEDVLRVELVWAPARVGSLLRLIAAGTPWKNLPEHAHWNWANKLTGFDPGTDRLMGITSNGEMQGLMRATTAGHLGRLAPDTGNPPVYVEFLESAPWNTRVFADSPTLEPVG